MQSNSRLCTLAFWRISSNKMIKMTPTPVERTHRCFSQSYLVLNYLHYVLGRGRRVELDGVVLPVHEMEPGVY